MRVLVCGGRHYADRAAVFAALDRLHAKRGIEAVITGEATGADSHARAWAIERDVEVWKFSADWDRLGRAAGPIRNQCMIDAGKPDGVVAFPGGDGTADMKRRVRAAGLTIWEPTKVLA